MAATLTDAGELTYLSFGIDKIESTPDGDLMCYGRASDGGVDHDDQIVDPQFSSKAIRDWLTTGGNIRVQHNAQRDPAGVGLEVNTDESGATWVKSLIVEPVAKKLLAAGALRAYSVGIARPTIVRDPVAKGGRITQGSICEISLVDRPANARCGIQLVKSADDGTPEYVGEMFGADDDIAKALGADVTKGADDDFVNVDLPRDASISISPRDMARLSTFKQKLTVEKHYTELAVKAAAGTDEPDIDTAKASATAADKETVEKADAPEAQDTATPDVTKDPKPKPVKKAKKKPKKLPPWLNKPSDDGSGGSDDDKGSTGDDGACKGAHAWIHVGGDGPVPDIRCEKCKTTPAEAAGLSGTHDMTAAPVPDLLESPPMASTKGSPTPQAASGNGEAPPMKPVPAHREPDGAIVEPFEKDAQLPATGQGETPTRLEAGMMKSSPEVAAILRFKSAGIDAELGRLHDLTCPAYHPDEVAKCHPFADLRNTDEGYFQREAVEAACGPSLDYAKSVHLAWQAARTLRETDPAVLNDYRLEAHKAFRDANPGPTSAPTPGMMTPGKFNRPLVTDGHSAASTGHSGPNTSPQVATTAPDAHSFDRPPLSAGHQSPSPSFMKSSFEYPDGTGHPQQLNYAQMDKERGRMALVEMHNHLGRQFPEVCPMDRPGDRPLRGVQPENHPVPNAVGAAKNVTPEPAPAAPAPVAAVFKAPAGDGEFADAEVYKGFKKARKKLGKKVLSGKMTVDEARSRLGRQFAQKAAESEPEVAKGFGPLTPIQPVPVDVPAGQFADPRMWQYPVGGIDAVIAAEKAATAEAVKTAVAEALASTAEATTELKDLLVKQQETFTEKLAEQQRVIDAIADQPDPSTASFSGLAFNPLRTKAAGPAGVPSQAEIAERTQLMMMRTMQDKYNSSSDPHEREAYYTTLCKMRGITEP